LYVVIIKAPQCPASAQAIAPMRSPTTIRLDPNGTKAYNNRGYAYNGKGGYNRAIPDASEAIHFDSKDAHAYANRATPARLRPQYGRIIPLSDLVGAELQAAHRQRRSSRRRLVCASGSDRVGSSTCSRSHCASRLIGSQRSHRLDRS
jgi:tetratricopeptide (TPR) repeat protein